MFRKSVSFFILVALFWVLLWVYIPDTTPGKLSVTDFFRSILLLFSFGAFGFALLMLLIRNFGVDLISAWIPHAGTAWWLGQHAYRFSQPKITLHLNYIGQHEIIQIQIKHGKQQFKTKLAAQMTEDVAIGILKSNPTISVDYGDKMTQQQELNIKHLVKRLGKNMVFEVIVDDHGLNYHNQQNNVPTADS
ncbi:MAG: hypothetical protein OQK49_01555 [Proteobacteria bacterium]|nr:hypothetical protein [Pseudomonadota bacterium]